MSAFAGAPSHVAARLHPGDQVQVQYADRLGSARSASDVRERGATKSLVFLVIGMVLVAIAWIAYERWSG
jgi:hypothetical protein